jgi:hypothetical protein
MASADRAGVGAGGGAPHLDGALATACSTDVPDWVALTRHGADRRSLVSRHRPSLPAVREPMLAPDAASTTLTVLPGSPVPSTSTSSSSESHRARMIVRDLSVIVTRVLAVRVVPRSENDAWIVTLWLPVTCVVVSVPRTSEANSEFSVQFALSVTVRREPSAYRATAR